MPTAINFCEISGPDAGALRRFYGDGTLGGGIWDASSAWSEADTTYAVFYVEVDDVGASVAAAEAAGAKVVIGRREHGPTISAHLLDPAGNRVGVYQMANARTD